MHFELGSCRMTLYFECSGWQDPSWIWRVCSNTLILLFFCLGCKRAWLTFLQLFLCMICGTGFLSFRYQEHLRLDNVPVRKMDKLHYQSSVRCFENYKCVSYSSFAMFTSADLMIAGRQETNFLSMSPVVCGIIFIDLFSLTFHK